MQQCSFEEVKKSKKLKSFFFTIDSKQIALILTRNSPTVPLGDDISTNADLEERAWLFEKAFENLHLLADNVNSRKLVIVRNYSDTSLAQCVSLVHLYLGEEFDICMTVYMRSWNKQFNFNYDIYTFCLLLSTCAKAFNTTVGNIEVICHDLHWVKK